MAKAKGRPKSKIKNETVMKYLLTLMLCGSLLVASAQDYKAAPVSLTTKWGKKVTPDNAWREYPRPQLVRKEWQNLNGLWDYAILKKGAATPKKYDGKILVPFGIESSLSGVGKSLLPDQELWYKTNFTIPANWNGKDIILHFDAVDWETNVWVNGKKVGSHKGGSDPFRFNIAPHLKKGGRQELTVSVWDPTDSDFQARGKQALQPKGIWYTPVSGIWQTVWMEPVAKSAITSLDPVPDIDAGNVTFNLKGKNAEGKNLKITVKDKGKTVKEFSGIFKTKLTLSVPDAKLWTPEAPHIYDVEVELKEGQKTVDRFSTYFAMRKISMKADEQGFVRLMLNHKPVFHYGTLDQGWWPDGLLTPPSDEAMKYDMIMLKEMGFNTIRKHIKVEPSRFYYHADTMGILLWQDMPSGFKWPDHPSHVGAYDKEDWVRPAASAKQFEAEWKSIMDHLRFFPSIVMWVPFNEGWGQYDTKRIAEWTRKYDPTRLVNAPSGWTDRGVGDVLDAHQYPGPGMYEFSLANGRSMVLGEFGGLGLVTKNHIWDPNKRNWGYKTYTKKQVLIDEYTELMHNMKVMIPRGLSAAIYTQTTDVEGEVNGLLTYDREVIKIPVDLLQKLHRPLYEITGEKVSYINQKGEEDRAVLHTATKVSGSNWASNISDQFNQSKEPVPVKKGGNIFAYQDVDISKMPTSLGMKLYGSGDAKVYINGNLVWKEDKLRIKRHYDDINLSDGIKYLKQGKNRIAVETTSATEDVKFDFVLYRLD